MTAREERASLFRNQPFISRKKVKGMVLKNEWEELGKLFYFTPIYLDLPSKDKIIDWRFIPQELLDKLKITSEIRFDKAIQHDYVSPRPAYENGYTPTLRQFLYDKQNGLCYYCQQRIGLINWTIEHVIPLSRGGLNLQFNKVGACDICNNIKGPLTEEEFRSTGYIESIGTLANSKAKNKINQMIRDLAIRGNRTS